MSRNFPRDEQFGLTNQLRRATVSVALNIAEGAGNESSNEFVRFLHIALRSLYETATAIEIAMRLNYCSAQHAKELIVETDEIGAMIAGLIKSIKKRPDYRYIRESGEEYDGVTSTE